MTKLGCLMLQTLELAIQKLFSYFSANHVCLMLSYSSISFIRFMWLSIVLSVVVLQRYKKIMQ
jgi:hypothetical protein